MAISANQMSALVKFDIPNLTSRSISRIEQDARGFLWIATDNGLNRFDGWTNIPYTYQRNDTTSLKSNQVEALFNDSEGNLWIGSGAGLQMHVHGSDRFRNVAFPGNILPSVRSIIQRGGHELLLVTSGFGAFTVDTHNMKATSADSLNKIIGTQYAHLIKMDALNRIWIAAANGRMVVVDKNMNLLHNSQFPGKVVDIASDKENTVYVATSSKVFRWNGAHSRFDELDDSPGWRIMGLMTDSKGDVMINTMEEGVFRITEGKVHPVDDFTPLKDEGLLVMMEDRDGDIWIGTRKGGIRMVSSVPDLFKFHEIPTSASVNIETIFDEPSCPGVSVALSDSRILSFDNNLRLLTTTDAGGRVTSSCPIPDGRSLLGYADGRIMVYSPNGMIQYDRLDSKEIHVLARDNADRLYAAVPGEGFYYKERGNDWRKVTEATPMATSSHLGNDWINAMVPDRSGLVWIGHCNGLDIFNPVNNRFEDRAFIPELRAHFVYSILTAKDGTVWIGTNFGLYHLFPEQGIMDFYGMKEGLQGNIICGIRQANNGDIWCTTNNGLSRIRYNDNRIINYISGNGLGERDYRRGLLLRTSGEKLYAAGFKGITSFFPDAISDERPLSPPVLTQISLNNAEDAQPEISYGAPDSDIAATVSLRHFQNTFSLAFSTFDYRKPGSITFEYRIPSLEKGWRSNPFGDNRVICNYMDHGRYTLEVRAVENGLASPVTKIRINILPPWYLTTWAKCIYILLTVGIIAGIWYTWTLRRRHKRSEEIAEENFRFFYNLAHELRSPITLMTSPLTTLIEKEEDNRKADTYRMIQRNGYRVINLVNEMLDIRRIEKGQMKLSFTETGMEDYLRQIVNDFRYQAESKGITLSFSAPDGDVRTYIDPDNFDKVIVNLIGNALKYTSEGGMVDVILRRGTNPADGGGTAVIEVCDTGTGIPPEQIGHIFERFYQGSRKNIGFGIGLNLSKMLIDLHHGTIKAANRDDRQGSRFSVTLPLGREYLSDDEITIAVEQPKVNYEPEERQRYIVAEQHDTPEEDRSRKGSSATARILVVDDDEEIRNYLKKELGMTYKVETACDGNEAYRTAQTMDFDLIISDVMMPDTDGITLLKKVRNNANLAHIPVILLTSSDNFETRMSGWAKGADAYLNKPFRIEELRQLCSSLISGRVRLKGRFGNGEKVEEAIETVEVKGNDDVFLEKVMKLVNENVGDSDFGVEELADKVGISRTHLHRRIKSLLGLTPREFLKSVRLRQAAELLKRNNINISQVGYMVGFSNPGQFSDSFKKFYGCTPSEYIEREVTGTMQE